MKNHNHKEGQAMSADQNRRNMPRFATLEDLIAKHRGIPNVVLPTGQVVTRAVATALGYDETNTTEVKITRWF